MIDKDLLVYTWGKESNRKKDVETCFHTAAGKNFHLSFATCVKNMYARLFVMIESFFWKYLLSVSIELICFVWQARKMRNTRVISRFKAREDILARESNPLKNEPLWLKKLRYLNQLEFIYKFVLIIPAVSFVEYIFLMSLHLCAASLESACCSFYVI